MSTNLDELTTKDFAQQCVDSLADVKRSMPKTWKSALTEYKDEISGEAAEAKVNNTTALLNIINRVNRDTIELSIIKMKHLFFLAAYCDML